MTGLRRLSSQTQVWLIPLVTVLLFLIINYLSSIFWLYAGVAALLGVAVVDLFGPRWIALAVCAALNTAAYAAGLHTQFANSFVMDQSLWGRILLTALAVFAPLLVGAGLATQVFGRRTA